MQQLSVTILHKPAPTTSLHASCRASVASRPAHCLSPVRTSRPLWSHRGSRFRYTYHCKKDESPNIGDAIIAMDHEAMRTMEDQDRLALQRYFAVAENTICGRNPITILLNTLALSARQYDLKFVHYSQSSKCRTPHDSSVSYAAAIVTEA
ncbi:Protein MEMO1-like protein [Diplonema papillatum]|nr:Protein MEMO1-like protein [Diplonema papillatum]KAJ9437413.1 Protein MEMO1-like protein [Diplonema papillatum]KAJ9444073.1 Protein MEMO1-like protein [Diplonema papillatum]KAJ9445770.1 Protein MEMO1-like protein [Diplonema papillatum]